MSFLVHRLVWTTNLSYNSKAEAFTTSEAVELLSDEEFGSSEDELSTEEGRPLCLPGYRSSDKSGDYSLEFKNKLFVVSMF